MVSTKMGVDARVRAVDCARRARLLYLYYSLTLNPTSTSASTCSSVWASGPAERTARERAGAVSGRVPGGGSAR